VPEHTPDRSRARLRRLGFSGALATLAAAFALSLGGIATTTGRLSADGEAAALVRQQQQQQAPARWCPHHQRSRRSDRDV
jgi:hypothetical protein